MQKIFLQIFSFLQSVVWFFIFFSLKKLIYFNWRLITLQYCGGFYHTLTWISHECTSVPAVPNLPPLSLPIPSLWVVPVHQLWVPCFMHRTWTGHLFHIWSYTCFNAILSNHPTLAFSPRVQKTVYTSVSLLLSRTQGYCYHLSKFHIYAIIYCIGVFLSDLVHSV